MKPQNYNLSSKQHSKKEHYDELMRAPLFLSEFPFYHTVFHCTIRIMYHREKTIKINPSKQTETPGT